MAILRALLRALPGLDPVRVEAKQPVWLSWAARPGLQFIWPFFPPPCSRVGFYVNTFQSIAGLEENFHKEMSKVVTLGCAPPAKGQGQRHGWAELLLPCWGWTHAGDHKGTLWAPEKQCQGPVLKEQSVRAQWELLGALGRLRVGPRGPAPAPSQLPVLFSLPGWSPPPSNGKCALRQPWPRELSVRKWWQFSSL